VNVGNLVGEAATDLRNEPEIELIEDHQGQKRTEEIKKSVGNSRTFRLHISTNARNERSDASSDIAA